MSVVVGLTDGSNVWLGGDHGSFEDEERTVRRDSKVFKKGSMLIGGVGSLLFPQLIAHRMRTPAHRSGVSTMRYLVHIWVPAMRAMLIANKAIKDDDPDSALTGSSLLLGYRGSLFSVDVDMNVGELHLPFAAIGAGSTPAVAAFAQQVKLGDQRPAQERVLDALAVSEAFCAKVSSPFTVVSTD